MAKNQSTYTLKIDAELGNLQQILNQAKNSLSSFMASGNAPKGLEKAFEKINDLLGQISDKTGKPLDLKGLAATGKDLTSVQESFKAIIRLLGEFDDLSDDIKLSFLSGDEQKKIQDASKALSDYGKAMEEVAKKQKLLEGEQKTNAKDKSALDKAKKKVSGLQDDRTLAQARLSGAQNKLNTVKGLENANPKDIAKYEAEVTKLTAELEILDKNLNEANAELNTAQTAYNTSAQSIKKMEAEIKRASGASLKQLKEEAVALGISLDGLNGHNAAKQVEILTDRLEEFKKETMQGAKPAFDAIKKGCEKAEKAADGLQDELKQAVDSTKQMDEAAASRDAFEAKIKSFLGLSGAAQVLRAALRDAMQTISELDTVMGQMAVVTDLTVGDYWEQLPEYSERASKLGVSITSAYEAATLYYQQGLKANEVTALSEQTLKMAAIAGLDAAEATDRMTAALRGFNMELNEANAQNIADVYSELAAITAADVDEISTAMTKTASIASSAGMEFETTAAFLSQIIETTRESAETAGTAMKTVIARFQELKKSPSEIGEIEGEIVDANAIETALRSVGVSLRDSAGQFRELDDVFLELSSKWDTLDKNTQRYIATIAAGSRQQSRFIAMMSDYKRTTELVTAANTSAGASNKQFEKTANTLAFKINQLKNAWHEFTMGIMNSTLVKLGVDILTKFLEIVNKATSAFDGLGGSITKIIGIVAIFNIGKILYEKIAGPIGGFFLQKLPALARESGLKIGKQIVDGAQEGISEEVEGGEGASSENQSIDKDKPTFKQRLSQTSGLSSIKSGLGKLRRKRRYEKANTRFSEAQENAYNDPEEYAKATEELAEAQAEYNHELDTSEKAYKDLSKGVKQAGQAITGAGVALSIFGGVLSSLGLEEAGEGITKFGNFLMITGTIASTVSPIISLLGKTVTVAGTKISIAGWIAQGGWLWVTGIAAAATALVVGVVSVFKAIKNNSPEAKLKKAQEAAEKAAEAAKQAKEAYEGLADAFKSLDDKYGSLEELTKGTREWNEAILEINKSVMDLIKQYPKLAKFVENTDGVLKIDFERQEVQNVLNEALEASIGAQNVATAADIAVLEAQANKDRAENYGFAFVYDQEYTKNQTQKDGSVVTTTTKASEGGSYSSGSSTNIKTLNNEQADILAKAVANGIMLEDRDSQTFANFLKEMNISSQQFDILEKSIENNAKELEEYGRSLLEKDIQEKAMYDSMANSVVNLVDTMGMSEERIKQMFNVADGTDYQQAYKEMANKLTDGIIDNDSGDGWGSMSEATGLTEKQMTEAFTQAGYTDGVFNVDTHKVTYKDESGKETSKELDEDEVRRIIATYYASDVVTTRAENSGAYISRMADYFEKVGTFKKEVTNEDGEKKTYTVSSEAVASAFEKALQDETGSLLTAADLDALNALSNEDWTNAFEQLPQVLKDTYGSVDNLKEEVKNAMTGAEYVTESGFEGVNAGAAKALNKIREATGQDATGEFTTGFNAIMNSEMAQADKDFISQQIASLSSDPKNREAWDAVREKLAGYGDAVTTFIDNQQAALDTRYSDTFLKNLGVSDAMLANYTNASGEDLARFHETFKKWKKDYDTVNSEAAQAEHELIEQTIAAIVENREKQIAAYEEAVNAEAEANSALIAKISDNVARLRELREQDEARKAITDNLSQQTYLAMDTSGANVLELQALQQEGEQMAQDYEDQLVDQAIAKLEEDNQIALEQRERQIELMREQLEIYANSKQIQEDAKQMIDDATEIMAKGMDITHSELGQLLKPEDLESDFAEAEYWTGLMTALNKREGITTSSEGEDAQKSVTQKRTEALDKVIDESGASGTVSSSTYSEQRQNYINAGGEGADFDRRLEELGIGVKEDRDVGYTDADLDNYNSGNSIFNDADLKAGENDNGVVKYGDNYYQLQANGKNKKTGFSTEDSASGKLEVVTVPGTKKAKLYINFNGTGYEINDEYDRDKLLQAMGLQAYATGGLADFTGPAWLDGTPSRPEYVLNADQTERFFSLIDVLESFNKNGSTSEKHGDNYFDININVDRLENDYDVEQMADKIRRMIYDDATYRNVNTINHIR